MQGRGSNIPEVFGTPEINVIAGGLSPIPVNTYRTQIDASTDLKTFGDGVWNIDVSVVFDTDVAATGAEGAIYLIPTSPIDLSDYDVLYTGGKVYDIDQSKDTNHGTVVYIVQELEGAVTSFTYGKKANLKVPVTNDLDTCLKRKAIKSCGCGKGKKVLDVWVDYLNSEMAFEDGDYVAANDLILGAGNTCKGGCGC